jgi:hypothetical protein
LIVKKCVLNLVNSFCAPIYYALFVRDMGHCRTLVYLLLAAHLVNSNGLALLTRR